jgi:hypothetical protein
MRKMIMLMLLSAWPCLAQEISPGPQQSPAQPSTGPQQTADTAEVPQTPQPVPTITVPEGTHLQLALANPIRKRDARIGDIVRAVTTFPVAAGQDVAIPQGSFVEGSIVRVGKHGPTRFAGLKMEFHTLVLSNGYTVALDGSVLDAKAIAPAANSTDAFATSALMANGLQQGPAPTPPPLPQVGPPKGPIIAATLGGMAALTVLGILFGHRHSEEARDFDTGFQFEIVLRAPLTLDRARVAAGVNGSNGD